MSRTNITDLDLNLLVALEALLTEESVTRAARRLDRSQPALSHSLRHLREVFEDQLLVPGQGGMQPTPLAQSLRAPLERVMLQIESLVHTEPDFEPGSTRRSFTMGCPDLFGVIVEDVVEWFAGEAPAARFDMVAPDFEDFEHVLETGRQDVTLGPTPAQASAQLRQRYLGDVEWCCLVRADHPVLSSSFTLETWTAYPHVVVHYRQHAASVVADAIEARGARRRIGASVPGFLFAPRVVAATDYIYTAPHMLASHAQREIGLVALRPPIELPEMSASIIWHERWDADAGHKWFREGVWTRVQRRWDDFPDFEG